MTRTVAEIERDLLDALTCHDMRGVDALLAELAVVDPLHLDLVLSVLRFDRPGGDAPTG